MSLSGKIALVTGASRGLGRAIALRLAQEGAAVALNYRERAAEAESVAQEIRSKGGKAIALQAHVADAAQVRSMVDRASRDLGPVDILVNNAGISDKRDGPPSVADPDAVRRVLEVNFFGVLAVTQAMLPLVRNSPSGRIVMVSSGLGSLTWNSDPAWSFAAVKRMGYNGSKALLNMMTVQLAWELRDTPIKVNTVNPGFTATDLNDHRGTQTVAEGAAETVRQSLAPDDAPTGKFVETGGIAPW